MVQATGPRKKYSSGAAIWSMSFLYFAAVPLVRWNLSRRCCANVSWMIRASSPRRRRPRIGEGLLRCVGVGADSLPPVLQLVEAAPGVAVHLAVTWMRSRGRAAVVVLDVAVDLLAERDGHSLGAIASRARSGMSTPRTRWSWGVATGSAPAGARLRCVAK